MFGDYGDLLYPIDLEINDTTDTAWSASYPDLYLEIDSESGLRTKFHDKRDRFILTIVNFPFICCNSPTVPANGKLYLSWYNIPEFAILLHISLREEATEPRVQSTQVKVITANFLINSTPPISTTWTITSHLNWTHWTQSNTT